MNLSRRCITDCSLLDMKTCSPAPKRRVGLGPITSLFDHLDWEDDDGCYNSSLFKSTMEFKSYTEFSKVISILMILVSVLGLVGNSVNILVLSRKSMRNCFNKILIALNICDSIHLIFAILDGVRNSFESFYPQWLLLLFPYLHYPLYRISLCCSIYLVISVAIERHSAVCNPLAYREQHAEKFRSLVYILPSFAFAFAVNFSRFFETETLKFCADFSGCGECATDPYFVYYIKPTRLRMNKIYITYYHTWAWVLLTGVLPFTFLLLLNFKILTSFRRLKSRINNNKKKVSHANSTASTSPGVLRQQSRDVNMSMVLISTVAVFLLCHTPRLVTSVYEAAHIGSILTCRDRGMDSTPLWYMFVTAAVQLLMVINASFNLPIYLFAGQHFRETLCEMLGLRAEEATQSRTLVTRVRSIKEEREEREEKVVMAVVADPRHSDNNNVSVTSL